LSSPSLASNRTYITVYYSSLQLIVIATNTPVSNACSLCEPDATPAVGSERQDSEQGRDGSPGGVKSGLVRRDRKRRLSD
jgi:hypothetical protein